MVIITVHAVTTFLLSKSSAWSRTCLCPKPTDSNQISQRLTDNCENFTVQLLECEDVQSLGAVVKTCLHNVVNNIASGALFYWEEAGRTLYTSDVTGTHVCSPCPECIRNVFRKGQHSVVDVSSIPDSILEHLNLSSSSTQNLKVGSYPVQDRKSGSVLAVLLVAGQHLGDATLCDLQVPLKQIAACYNHIQRTFQSPRNTEERVSQQLIKLCGDLCDQDAAQLQLKVLRYLEEETQAECSFLLMVVPETQELFCQVVGRRILPEEIRFPGPSSSFSTALESKQPITLEDIPKENIKGIEELVCCPLRSLLCVPVTSRADNNLIALACVINKLNANRFTDRDISTIRQCFRYTVTVLTSTLAFQNEHKLKVQTQALLQVARHLFTNLGEFKVRRLIMVFTYLSMHLADIYRQFGSVILPSYTINNNGIVARPDMMTSKTVDKAAYGDRSLHDNGRPIGRPDDEINHEEETVFNIKTDTEKNTTTELKGDIVIVGKDYLKTSSNDTRFEKGCLGDDEAFLNEKAEECHMIIEQFRGEIIKDTEFRKSLASLELDIDNSLQRSLKLSKGADDSSFQRSLELLKGADNSMEDRELNEYLCKNWDTNISDDVQDSSNDSVFAESFDEPLEKALEIGDISIESQYKGDNLDQALVITKKKIAAFPGIENDRELDHNTETTSNLVTFHVPDAESVLVTAYLSDDKGEPFPLLESVSDTQLSYTTASSERDHDVDNVDMDGNGDRESIDSKSPDDKFFDSHESLADRFTGLSLEPMDLRPDILGFPPTYRSPNINRAMKKCFSEPLFSHEKTYCKDDSAAAHNDAFLHLDTTNMNDTEIRIYSMSHSGQVRSWKAIHDVIEAFSEPKLDDASKEQSVVVSLSDVDLSDIQVPTAVCKTINLDDLTKLLREIMQQARNLTNAERCSVFLIDNDTDELVAKVFDGITTNKNNEVQEEIRLPISQGIAGKVATSGELLNIKDAYSHPLFYRGIDDTTGFRTRNILCFPIKDEKGRVLGVAQLCNKKNGPCFTQFDEEVATAFGIYCCISISHSLMYKKLLDTQHRKSLANELMIYHMQVSPDDVTGLSSCDIPHPRMIHPDFIQFSYAPRTLPEDRTLLACLSMFEDLNLLNRWRIKRETIARFILMVRKGYRNPPYHNWMHAYTVAQFCYQLIRNLKLENQLEEIEIFSLFVSCLCHDIDHRGTNNSFQTASKSVLAALYSSEGSVLERHHFAQTMCILNTEGCNVFENLSSKDYQTVLDLMRDIILATDLAHHFKIMKNLTELANKGYDRTVMKDRKHVLCLMMTACDLSDQTRPWDNTKRVAALIYKEFFSQGDMEKARGIQPHEMYDRDKAHIPAVQISFLDHVVLPAYRILARMFKPVEECAESVEQNKRHWERLSELIRVKRGGSTSCMTFEEVLAMEQEEIDTDHVVLNHALTNGEQS
ncbi:cGMP-dependent 3',5'-cyclic phosphodiesterase-like isoform X1 [Dreissena polymorpha]|uniref:cGMP-dependent 3',5'-cyclic phosphodiesterase-like isoform X1 n=1 Tax=Dreissena polymorpha TaxID=45954 RepID=UPI002264217B|nr:cGMP-dependent 3',5'-cyclic phosphodiesterase-like isoform X1 [Dreissena polymorpha]